MNHIFVLSLAVLSMLACSLSGNEPSQTIERYFSFFNPENTAGTEYFKECFVPEERSKIKPPPALEIRSRYPIGTVHILDEVRTGNRYEIRYRLSNRSGVGYLVLENREGLWLISLSGSSSGRKDALSFRPEEIIPGPLDLKNPVPQPLLPPPPPLPPVPSGWQPGPSPEWYAHFGAASETARRDKRSLFILCTGADWCGPCKRLAKDVFQSAEFKEYAAKHLVLLYLNFPRRNPLPSEQMKHNMEIRRKFGFRGGVPSYVLVNPDGQILRRRSGYLPLPAFMGFLQPEEAQPPSAKPQRQEPSRRQEKADNERKETPATAIPSPPGGWRPGLDAQWQIYYPAAMALAKQNHKKVFILHTGSDWCGFCIKLRKDVLTHRVFKRFAEKNLILLYLDSPRKNPLPQDQQRHNQEVCRELGFTGGVPAFILLDENGKVIVKRAGYRPLRDYMKLLKEAVKK